MIDRIKKLEKRVVHLFKAIQTPSGGGQPSGEGLPYDHFLIYLGEDRGAVYTNEVYSSPALRYNVEKKPGEVSTYYVYISKEDKTTVNTEKIVPIPIWNLEIPGGNPPDAEGYSIEFAIDRNYIPGVNNEKRLILRVLRSGLEDLSLLYQLPIEVRLYKEVSPT